MAGLVIGTDKTATIPVLEKEIPTVINSLNVTPSTSAQTITAPSGVDGYSPVNVAAVNASIDANITAGNIKKDVTILGVTGSYEGSTPAHYIEYGADANNKLTRGLNIIDLTGVVDIPIERGLYYLYYNNTDISGAVDFSSLNDISGIYACQNMFRSCTGLTSVVLSGLTTLSGNNACNSMFYGCTGITSVRLSSLIAISGGFVCASMFYNCTGITSVDLMALGTISGSSACINMFYGCTGLMNVSLPSLIEISGSNACQNMFRNCTNLTSFSLYNLTTISGTYATRSMFGNCYSLTTASFPSLDYIPAANCLTEMFNGCNSLTDVSFPALKSTSFGSATNQFQNMLSGCSNVTVHFPSSLFAVIGSWSDVAAGFGGTSTTVLYDLPATE